MKQAKQS